VDFIDLWNSPPETQQGFKTVGKLFATCDPPDIHGYHLNVKIKMFSKEEIRGRSKVSLDLIQRLRCSFITAAFLQLVTRDWTAA